MLYHYLAAEQSGRIVESDIDADNMAQVLQYLAGRGLRPVTVKPVAPTTGGFRNLFSSIKTVDKVFLTKYLSLMLKVGTDLLSAINILIADFEKPAMKSLLLEIRENLTKGRPFYEAFSRYPRVFSKVFVNLVKAAEASGNLQETFDDLSVSLEEEVELKSRIRGAMIYPVILLCASLAIFIFLVTFAVPKIAKVFLDTGVQPPIFSRIVFGVGLFVSDHIIIFAIASLLIVGPGIYIFGWTELGKRLLSQIASRMPVLRNIYRDIAVHRFLTTFSSLMKAGLPILDCLHISAEVVSAPQFRLALLRVADEGISKGLTIGDAFRRETVFPRVVTNLISISEKAGHLEEVLNTLAHFYSTSIDAGIKSLVSLLEPALLLLMGFLVGGIALSIIVPIYQLTSQF